MSPVIRAAALCELLALGEFLASATLAAGEAPRPLPATGGVFRAPAPSRAIVRPVELDPQMREFAFGPSLRTERMDPNRPVKPWGPAPYDWGGLIRDYGARVKKLGRVEIRGTCVSACTMYLAVRGVCVDKYALLWFHAAFDLGTGRISPAGSAELRAHWPKPVRDWAARVGALESVTFTWRRALSGVELIAMGVPACPTSPGGLPPKASDAQAKASSDAVEASAPADASQPLRPIHIWLWRWGTAPGRSNTRR